MDERNLGVAGSVHIMSAIGSHTLRQLLYSDTPHKPKHKSRPTTEAFPGFRQGGIISLYFRPSPTSLSPSLLSFSLSFYTILFSLPFSGSMGAELPVDRSPGGITRGNMM